MWSSVPALCVVCVLVTQMSLLWSSIPGLTQFTVVITGQDFLEINMSCPRNRVIVLNAERIDLLSLAKNELRAGSRNSKAGLVLASRLRQLHPVTCVSSV